MPGTNTLAYLASSSVIKEKSFITLTPGVAYICIIIQSVVMLGVVMLNVVAPSIELPM